VQLKVAMYTLVLLGRDLRSGNQKSEDMISPVLIEEVLLDGMRFQDVVRSINSIKESISGSGTVNNVTIDFFQIDIMKKNFCPIYSRWWIVDVHWIYFQPGFNG
jgi:hypothetical protein